MDFLGENEWLQLILIIVIGVLFWKIICKPVLIYLRDDLSTLLKPIKCLFGFHDKEYGIPSEVCGTHNTRVWCKNPKCDWEDQESKFIE